MKQELMSDLSDFIGTNLSEYLNQTSTKSKSGVPQKQNKDSNLMQPTGLWSSHTLNPRFNQLKLTVAYNRK